MDSSAPRDSEAAPPPACGPRLSPATGKVPGRVDPVYAGLGGLAFLIWILTVASTESTFTHIRTYQDGNELNEHLGIWKVEISASVDGEDDDKVRHIYNNGSARRPLASTRAESIGLRGYSQATRRTASTSASPRAS